MCLTELAGEGTDTVRSFISFTLAAEFENLTLLGSANIDGFGNSLANTLTGNSGNNLLDGGGGVDSMTGGAGDDTYVVDVSGETISDSSGIDTVRSFVTYTLGTSLENLTLLGTATTGTGNNSDNVIIGNDVANTLSGGSGNDTLDGGLGGDSMTGGSGTTPSSWTPEAIRSPKPLGAGSTW